MVYFKWNKYSNAPSATRMKIPIKTSYLKMPHATSFSTISSRMSLKDAAWLSQRNTSRMRSPLRKRSGMIHMNFCKKLKRILMRDLEQTGTPSDGMQEKSQISSFSTAIFTSFPVIMMSPLPVKGSDTGLNSLKTNAQIDKTKARPPALCRTGRALSFYQKTKTGKNIFTTVTLFCYSSYKVT